MSDLGPSRPGARAFRPRLDESVDGEPEAHDAPAAPQQGVLPFAEFAEPQGDPGPRARKRYPRLRVDDLVPDVRDGLTRAERLVLWMLHEAQKEFPGRNVPTALLYGRVVEHINLSVPEFQNILARMVGVK